MNENIYFELAAIPLYVVLFVTTIYRRMTKGRSNVLFLLLTFCSLAAVIADLIGTIDDRTILASDFGLAFVKGGEYVYFLTRNGINVLYLLFIFSVTRTWHRLRGTGKKLILLFPYVVIVTMILSNPFTDAVFTITVENAYKRGPYIGVIYICAASYMLFGIIYLTVNKRVLERDEWVALYTMNVLNSIAVLIQLLFPEMLIECFMTALTLLLVVMFIQRPEKQVDVSTNLPAVWAFNEELDKISHTGQKVQIVIAGIKNAVQLRDRAGEAVYYDFVHYISNVIEICARDNRIRYELYYESPGYFYTIIEDMSYNPAGACSEISNSIKSKKGRLVYSGIQADAAIAVVRYPDEIDNKEELMWFAHNFLRFAKNGKVYSHASQITEKRDYRIETRIIEIVDKAIREKSFKLSYDPIWSVNRARADFAEAMLSLHDEELGDIDDDMLYRAARERGIIGRLGEYVAEEVFSYVGSESFAKSGYRGILIRLSVAHARQADYPDSLWNIREKYGVHPEQICFAVDAPDSSDMEGELGKNMLKLSLMGYRFCYDGYGFGHSELQSIKKLPFFSVRLDRKMLKGSVTDEGREILEGSIHLLKRVALEVVAQDVDDKETADMLSRMGCDYIQGRLDEYTFPAKDGDVEILVVDDNSPNRTVIKALLNSGGFCTDEAESGEEAVLLARKKHFDIIFMDHLMPGMDGISAMKRIREEKGGMNADTPIVILTANTDPGSKKKYLEAGFDGWAAKPVEAERLFELMGKLLPEKKLKPAGNEGEKGENSENTDGLPQIFGIDWTLAMMRLNSREALDKVLREFWDTIDHQADKLDGLLEGLPETFGDYRITVHGMKGAAGTAGIITLSGMAAVLEEAAAKEDEDTVKQLHGIFIREWRSYKGRLGEYLGSGSVTGEEIGEAELKVLLDMLLNAMEDMDIDTADEVISKLASLRLPEYAASSFGRLRTAVTELDADSVAEIVKETLNKASP